ncbi:hypothetical protein KEM54_000874, partial [Ascosphaera aggregata]
MEGQMQCLNDQPRSFHRQFESWRITCGGGMARLNHADSGAVETRALTRPSETKQSHTTRTHGAMVSKSLFSAQAPGTIHTGGSSNGGPMRGAKDLGRPPLNPSQPLTNS